MHFILFHRRLGCDDESATEEEQAERILYYYPENTTMAQQLSRLSCLVSLIDFASKFSEDPIQSVTMDNATWAFVECEPCLFVAMSFENKRSDRDDSNLFFEHVPNGICIADVATRMYRMYATFYGSVNSALTGKEDLGWEAIRSTQLLRKRIRKIDIRLKQEVRDVTSAERSSVERTQHEEDNNSLFDETSDEGANVVAAPTLQAAKVVVFESLKEREQLKLALRARRDDTPATLRRWARNFFGWFISTGEALRPGALHSLAGMHFAPVGHPAFQVLMRLRQAVEECTRELSKGVLVLHDGQIIWSDLDNMSTFYLYDFIRLQELHSLRENCSYGSFDADLELVLNEQQCESWARHWINRKGFVTGDLMHSDCFSPAKISNASSNLLDEATKSSASVSNQSNSYYPPEVNWHICDLEELELESALGSVSSHQLFYGSSFGVDRPSTEMPNPSIGRPALSKHNSSTLAASSRPTSSASHNVERSKYWSTEHILPSILTDFCGPLGLWCPRIYACTSGYVDADAHQDLLKGWPRVGSDGSGAETGERCNHTSRSSNSSFRMDNQDEFGGYTMSDVFDNIPNRKSRSDPAAGVGEMICQGRAVIYRQHRVMVVCLMTDWEDKDGGPALRLRTNKSAESVMASPVKETTSESHVETNSLAFIKRRRELVSICSALQRSLQPEIERLQRVIGKSISQTRAANSAAFAAAAAAAAATAAAQQHQQQQQQQQQLQSSATSSSSSNNNSQSKKKQNLPRGVRLLYFNVCNRAIKAVEVYRGKIDPLFVFPKVLKYCESSCLERTKPVFVHNETNSVPHIHASESTVLEERMTILERPSILQGEEEQWKLYTSEDEQDRTLHLPTDPMFFSFPNCLLSEIRPRFPFSPALLSGCVDSSIMRALNELRVAMSDRSGGDCEVAEGCLRVASMPNGGVWVLGRRLGDRLVFFIVQGCATLNEMSDQVQQTTENMLGQIMV